SAVGAGTAAASYGSVQQRYDVAYVQCMYAKGNQVPAARGTSSAYAGMHAPVNVPPPPPGPPPPAPPMSGLPPPSALGPPPPAPPPPAPMRGPAASGSNPRAADLVARDARVIIVRIRERSRCSSSGIIHRAMARGLRELVGRVMIDPDFLADLQRAPDVVLG